MSTITTIASGDNISDSRTVINTNFSNLNTDKVEGPATSTDNAIARYNGAGGVTLQNTGVLIDDSNNLNLAASTALQVATTAILSDSAGTMTLSNIDALDATTEATIESAIDTLSNLVSIQDNTFTLTGDFIRSGAHPLTLTTTGATDVTLPTTGTLATNPMTTGGDVIYGGGSGVPTRLANGSNGQILTSNGTTTAPSWENAGAAAAAGTDTQVQFNDGGTNLGADAGMTYNKTSDTLTLAGDLVCEDLQLEDSDGSHYLTLTTTSNLTAGRTLTLVPGDAARTLTLAGDLNIAADLITSGANSLTLTTTGATDVTLPTTGTLLANLSEDGSPQLGADLDVNGNSIISASDGDIAITPNGTGDVVLDGLKYPQADGSGGQFMQTDGAGQLSFAPVTAGSANALVLSMRKGSAGTLTKGVPVYLSGWNASGYAEVELADANDAAKMPAITIADQDITNVATVDVVVSGNMTGMVTDTFSVGDRLFIADDSTLTATRPVNAIDAVQSVGTVIRSHLSAGVIQITGAGRSNAIPNKMSDAHFRICDDGDSTALVQTDASGITTGTTRTITLQDVTGTMALQEDKLSDFAATSSAELKTVISDETGSGLLVFGTSPTLVTPVLGTPSSGNLSNCASYPAATSSAQGIAELAIASEIDTGTDTTRIMPIDQFVASKRNIRWLSFNLVEAATDCATATNIAGDFVSPIAGTILQSDSTPFYLYATNSTAGTTGTMVVDISIGGTSIMTTNKLDFDTTEKTTTTAATPPDLTTTALAVGDIITIDIDSVHTTAAKGLTVYMAVRES